MKTIASKCAKEGITLEQSISTTVKKTWYLNPLKQRPLIYKKNTPNSCPTAALLPAAPVPNPIWFLTPIIYITQLPWVLLLQPALLSQGAATAPSVLSPDPEQSAQPSSHSAAPCSTSCLPQLHLHLHRSAHLKHQPLPAPTASFCGLYL